MSESSIAHYRITDKLGKGGMGEVYRATDTKLNREVALKILPDVFANDPDRMARFSREAQVLASLNHPNIASIHGLEESGDKRALVMELVEGETLAERLKRGAIALEEALKIARQIAEALEEAHERGIIHRDLKPANVKVTPNGTVKVLDFGLAKALEGEARTGSSPDLSQSPTLSAQATAAGVILGTAAYMSPEQARGQRVDRRSDIWSFGVLLFEMLTGRQTFTGDTVTDVLASVLKTEVAIDSLPPTTPPAVRRLVRRSLTRDPRQRLQSMGEARIAIDEYLEKPGGVEQVVTPAARQPAWLRVAPWAAAAAGGALALALWMRAPGTPPPMRVNVEVTPAIWTEIGAGAILSPDGQRLAYIVGTGLDTKLYVRSLERLEGTLLSGTEVAYHPFFSPDGEWVGFVTPSELKKVSVSGGAPLKLCEVNRSRGASWAGDDTILFAPTPASGLHRVSAAGGAPEPVTVLDEAKGEISHRWPQVLPGGKAVLFTSHSSTGNYDNANIEVLSLASGERKIVHRGGSYARYVPTGHVVYVREGTLFALPFDLSRLEATGSPAPLLEGVMSDPNSEGTAQFDFSHSGTLAYLTGTAEGPKYQLVWVDREGRATSFSEDRLAFDTPRFSPDGTRLAVTVDRGATADVWIYDLTRGVSTRLTFGGSLDAFPFWSPDGRYVGFSSDRSGGVVNLYWNPADGSGDSERLTESKNFQSAGAISPDGKLLIFHEPGGETDYDLWILPLQGERKPEVFLATPFAELEPDFSPDGRWVAYHSNESGTTEVYVRPFPARGGKWQISKGGGTYPRWSRNGKELFYRTEKGIMVVSVDISGESLRADKPRLLFEGPFEVLSFAADYDVAPDGKQFVMLKADEVSEERAKHSHLTLVTDWFGEIRRTFSSKK